MILEKIRCASERAVCLASIGICMLVAGCSHHRVHAPAPPAPPAEVEQPASPTASTPANRHYGRILSSQTGIASWYGAPYRNARAANGKVYNQNALTAAHRILPLGTIVRVTNLSTRQWAIVTITDRGPFVRGRIIDLSRAAAIKTGVWRTGTARVRIDVLEYPAAGQTAGKWCVQIGAFQREKTAKKLRDRLLRKYADANVIDFKGATGYWVRIKPSDRSERQAQLISRGLHLSEGAAYLVRLD